MTAHRVLRTLPAFHWRISCIQRDSHEPKEWLQNNQGKGVNPPSRFPGKDDEEESRNTRSDDGSLFRGRKVSVRANTRLTDLIRHPLRLRRRLTCKFSGCQSSFLCPGRFTT